MHPLYINIKYYVVCDTFIKKSQQPQVMSGFKTINEAREYVENGGDINIQISDVKNLHIDDVIDTTCDTIDYQMMRRFVYFSYSLDWSGKRDTCCWTDRYCDCIDRAFSFKKSTPLMTACRTGKGGIVEYLLKQGADVTLKDEWGNTALDYATFEYHKIYNGPRYKVNEIVRYNGPRKQNIIDLIEKKIEKNIRKSKKLRR